MEDYLRKIEQLETENLRLTQENTRLQEKLNVALDGNGLCLWEQHVPTGALTIFNMEWGKMLGYQPNELSATVDIWKSKLHPDDYHLAVDAYEDHIAGKTDLYQVVHRMIHKDGGDSWVSDRGRVVEFDESGAPLRMMGTHIDITQEKRYEIQLASLANSDPLTNLLNRKAIEDCFYSQKSVHKNSDSSLIFIDVDNFKAVNDGLGHKAGDNVLIDISSWLIQCVFNDSKIGRLGGDEFVILCYDLNRFEIEALCNRLLSFSSPTLLAAQTKVDIGLSIGVCLFNNNNQRFDDIYEHADLAMYQVKKNGKNNVAIIDINNAELDRKIAASIVE
ncbi:sensor domain-containing diguanylate cyclase [Vibrio kyushuensis]|uniref:GGDEF domain-containing protein n=1 Tax=Vibrio kyushuensis TaxID=2910249 RepID=UPI003D112BE3